MSDDTRPLVGILMGSDSDWPVMRNAPETLNRFGVPNEYRVASAHRSPALATEYASTAAERGLEVVIAAAGGAAHLAGVIAAHTPLPVLGVPLSGWALDGLDALLATVQMPKGVPVGTLAIGKAGAINAALLSVRILALSRPELAEKLRRFQEEETRKVTELELEL
ncbi:MAG: 5-(carboxyamino)imidazole ribonucleotide mutase [bacterium]|nr:5-(carboxyamino)imidazole ribonucleotide mutase [bacterium]